ncbi:hypothetical protein LPJ61_003395 [Coemansia biformis]|uniref:Major facilitator superfamily (MFS) profile domain-containing protein n=1 Tax=Coemansia biformis TaxID=1286918 RepID=A0A9W8CYN5_9FUNG|nr:hypothetical protein LPJ61_003395 [Coemansia biformis]
MQVTLQSSDEREFVVSIKVAEQSQLLKTKIEELGEKSETIVLSDIKGDVLKKIIEYCEHYQEDPADGSVVRGLLPPPQGSSWDKAYIKVEAPMLCELLKAAHTLKIPQLLDLGCSATANLIRGKSAAEIREVLHIRDDFSEDEQKLIGMEAAFSASSHIIEEMRDDGRASTPLLGPPPAAINQALALSDKEQAELASYVQKCDRRIMAYLCIGYAADSVNKMTLANAKVAGIEGDLGMAAGMINWALGLYYVGSFLGQLPANLALKKVHPGRWLSGTMVAWSVVTAATAFVQTGHQLVACRFLFGAVQAGYLTGSLYYISFWYPRGLVRQRTGFFFASAGVGGVAVGPLCAMLMPLDTGLQGWQNLFVAAGLLSGIWGALGLIVLPDYPERARFLTADERRLVRRIMEHQNTVASTQRISVRQIRMAVADYRIWLWALVDFCANAATQVNGMFGPTIIADQGYSPRAAQALTALTNFMAFSGMASIAYVARAVGGSSTAIALSNTLTAAGFVLALTASDSGARMAALLLFSFASPQPAAHGPAWAMANQQGDTKPAIAATLTSAFGGLGPLTTAFVYRESDRPRYVLGHSVCLAMTVLCLAATLTLRAVLLRENTRRDRCPRDISDLSAEQTRDLADSHPDFRYRL